MEQKQNYFLYLPSVARSLEVALPPAPSPASGGGAGLGRRRAPDGRYGRWLPLAPGLGVIKEAEYEARA